MTKKLIIFSLPIVIFSSCIEKFDPPAHGYENLLVVEGYLADSRQDSEVKLSRSIPLDTSAWIPVTGASVRIYDESGETFLFHEIENGIYKPESTVNANIGFAYQLHITTSSNKTYKSEWVTMRDTPPIDSVTWKYEEKPDLGVEGIQIIVDTHDPENNTWYYRWDWVETWIFHSAFESEIYWEDNQIKVQEENIYTCWRIHNSADIKIATSSTLDQDIISNYPLFYVSNTTNRLNRRYSVNVKQYSLSEESYIYWKELEKITENMGTLFDPLPSTLDGNVYNVDNKDETVIGYFDAAVVAEKRIFVEDIDLPYMKIPDPYMGCRDTISSYAQIPTFILQGFDLFDAIPSGTGTAYLLAEPYCIDCRFTGTNKRPDYW